MAIAGQEGEMMTPEERAKQICRDWRDERKLSYAFMPEDEKSLAKAIHAAIADETARLQRQLSLSQAAVAELQRLLQAAEQRQAEAVAAGRAGGRDDDITADVH